MVDHTLLEGHLLELSFVMDPPDLCCCLIRVPGGESEQDLTALLSVIVIVVLRASLLPQLGRPYHGLDLDPGVSGGHALHQLLVLLLLPSGGFRLGWHFVIILL